MHRASLPLPTVLGIAFSLLIGPSRAWAAPQPPPPEPIPPVAPLPAPLEENDEMLQPIAPAPHVAASWDEALAELRSRSTDLRIALDEVDRSSAQWRSTLASSLPTLTGTGNVTWSLLRGKPCDELGCTQVLVPNAINYTATFTLSHPLVAPRAWHAAGTAKRAIDVAELSAEDVKRSLTLALANAIVSVVTAERISEINRVGLRAALDRLTLARRRVSLGAANALDTVRADQDVSVARSAVVSGDESLRQARETLGLALGSTEPWGVPVDINLNGVEASARNSCSGIGTLEERADFAAARGSLEIAKRNVVDAWLRQSPTVDVVSTFGLTDTTGEYPQTFASGLHQMWSIAAVLTVPFYDGGLRYGLVRENRALVDESTQRLEALRRQANIELTQARRAVDVAEQNQRVAERARDLARETERLSRIAFQAGAGTSLDLIESGRQLREAEIQLALQEFGVVRARLAALIVLSQCHW
jgi:outer membrane protein TolC